MDYEYVQLVKSVLPIQIKIATAVAACFVAMWIYFLETKDEITNKQSNEFIQPSLVRIQRHFSYYYM